MSVGKFYVLVCRQCGDGGLPMPFESPEARGHWAAEHTKGTGHSRWFVVDQDREPGRDYSHEVLARMARHDEDVVALRSWNESLRQGGTL